MTGSCKITCFVWVLVLVTEIIYAQVQEQLSPTEKKYQSVVTEPLTTYKGFLRAGLAASYGVIDKIFHEDGSRKPIDGNVIADSWNFFGYAQYGITNRLQFELNVPYRIQQQSQNVRFEFPGIDSAFVQQWKAVGRGFGDLDMTVGYQVIEPTQTQPAIGFFVTATVPTAGKNPTNVDPENQNNYNIPIGSGEFALQTQVKYRKIAFPYSYNIFLGYKAYFGGNKLLDPSDTQEKSFKTGNYVSVAASFNTHLNNWIVFKNFIDSYIRSSDEEDGIRGENSWVVLYYPGLSFQMKRFRLDQSVIFPLAGKLSSADISFTIAFQYTF